jgi:hypothetical protein
MSCSTDITKKITSDCSTASVGGVEITATFWNRNKVDVTFDGTNHVKVTGLSKPSGVTAICAYELKGFKNNQGYKSTDIIAENFPTRFKHTIAFDGYEFDASSIENLDSMDDICIVFERKHKPTSGDGVFVGFGFESGLWRASGEMDSNANSGVRKLTFATLDASPETQSQYNVMITALVDPISVYADTKAALLALTTVTV